MIYFQPRPISKLIFLGTFLLLLTIPFFTSAQVEGAFEIQVGIYKNYPAFSMDREELREVNAINDFNINFDPSWVKEYLEIKIIGTVDGKESIAKSYSETLTMEQKKLLMNCDNGKVITIDIDYLPDNTLRSNDPKNLDFAITINPESEAYFPSGQIALQKYLKVKIMDKIPSEFFTEYALYGIKFVITEDGNITKQDIFWPTKDKRVDDLLREALCDMPNWEPAAYVDGLRVPQECVLLVGDMRSCVSNLVNLKLEN